jgi:hypothetical protein
MYLKDIIEVKAICCLYDMLPKRTVSCENLTNGQRLQIGVRTSAGDYKFLRDLRVW